MATAASGSSPSPGPQRAIQIQYGDSDNSGTRAWRRNEEPRGKVPIPMNANGGGLEAEGYRVARETGTYVKVSRKARSYQIWGDPDKVNEAMLQLGKRTSALTHSRSNVRSGASSRGNNNSVPWAKVRSPTTTARQIQEDILEAEEIKKHYQRNPLPDDVFESIGTFVWPKDTTRPDVTFGSSCESLDDIRTECSCHIVYNHTSGSLRVMGKKLDVLKALVRVRAAFRQAVASQHLSSTAKTYNLHYHAEKDVHERVTLQCVDATRIIYPRPAAVSPQKQKLPRGQGRLYSNRPSSQEHLLHDVAEKVGNQLMEVLSFIRYYRGFITLRVRLGTFHLLSFQDIMYNAGCGLEEFQKMMKDPLFDGAVTQELGNRAVEVKAWERMVSTDGFFDTQSSFVHDLCDVQPTYTATLTLDEEDYGLQLVRSWKEADGELVEAGGPSWYRLDKGAVRSKFLLETCVIDLEDGLSWQFEMQATRPIDAEKLKPEFQELGLYFFTIKEQEARQLRDGVIWCEFEKNAKGYPRPVKQKKALELRVAWQFGIENSDYTVEVAKVQGVKFELKPNGEKEAVIFESRWTVHVVHRGWQEKLALNTNIGIGKDATWRADMETWFPLNDDAVFGVTPEKDGLQQNGCVVMLEKLFRIQQIIRGQEEGAN